MARGTKPDNPPRGASGAPLRYGRRVSDVDLASLTIAVLGGPGPQGPGLARRFAGAGLTVVLGSRTESRAAEAAAALGDAGAVSGATNAEAGWP